MSKTKTVGIFLLIPSLLAIGSLGVARAVQSGQTPAPKEETISLSISLVDETVKSPSPVVLKIVLTNISDHDISYSIENGENGWVIDYFIDAWDDKQSEAERTKFGKALKGRSDPAYMTTETPMTGSAVERILKVGESVTDHVSASKIYDLSKPGKYTIQVRRFDEERKIVVKSNKTTATVTP